MFIMISSPISLSCSLFNLYLSFYESKSNQKHLIGNSCDNLDYEISNSKNLIHIASKNSNKSYKLHLILCFILKYCIETEFI